jgi:hypothetical protein
MSTNDRVPSKAATRGTNRKTSINPTPGDTAQSERIRNTRYADDDEFLMSEDDEFASNPPTPTSAIRINQPLPPGGRVNRTVNTDTQQQPTTTRRSPMPPVDTYTPTPKRRSQSAQTVDPRLAATQQAPARPARNVRNTTSDYGAPAGSKPAPKGKRNVHWLLYVGIGMLAALPLWILSTTLLAWGTNEYNNIIYGYPRTYQVDAVVGHNNDSTKNPSHFIALNLHGQVIIVEFPAGDPSKAIDYTGPDLVGPGDDQIPITLTFTDLNHDGKVDMIVHIAGREIIFYNNGTKFVPPASD